MRALVTGITGQDGSYLAEQLTGDGHQVWGLVRGHATDRRRRLSQLVPSVRYIEGDLLDQVSLMRALYECEPDVVFNLGGISAPAMAWAQPALAADVIGLGFLRLVEAVRDARPRTRIVQAGSLATHGVYGASKAFTARAAADYRERGVHVTVAVLGGHHSPRRGREFFARKVTHAAACAGLAAPVGKLELGWLGRGQDWGRAPDFMRALTLLADLTPGEYTVSTGSPRMSQEWVEAAYAAVDLDWRDHVVTSGERQPTDVALLSERPDERLVAAGWNPSTDFEGLARWMVRAETTGEAW